MYLADSDDDASLGRPARRAQGRPRAPLRHGTFGAFLVARSPAGAAARSAGVGVLPPTEQRTLLGLGHFEWSLKPGAPEPAVSANVAGGPVVVPHGPSAHWASVEYKLVETWALDIEPWHMPADFDYDLASSALTLQELTNDFPIIFGGTVRDTLAAAPVPFQKVVVLPSEVLVPAVGDAEPVVVQTVRLGARVNYGAFLGNVPSKASVRRWRKDLGGARPREPSSSIPPAEAVPADRKRQHFEDVLLQVPLHSRLCAKTMKPRPGPAKFNRERDPVNTIKALDFNKFLRATDDCSKALDAAHAYDTDDRDKTDRDDSKDPRRATLDRADARLDVFGMSLDRRQWHAEMAVDDVDAVSIYSDASPVTGCELQGMVCEVCRRDGSVRKLTLPGSSLSYGQYNSIAKTIAFVWAVWLCFGPDWAAMSYFFSRVRSITTDNGVEMHTIEMPDILMAFMHWLAGVPLQDCAQYIDYSTRLFRNALRVTGWSHGLGNIMRDVAGKCSRWPKVLDDIRALCTFFRNESWRLHLQWALHGKPIDWSVLEFFGVRG